MPELQDRTFQILKTAVRGRLETRGRWPEWIQRPGRLECGNSWELLQEIYSQLTDGEILPDTMPRSEYRTLDGILIDYDGRFRIVEVDESQHFTSFRAQTLKMYPPEVRLAFPQETWLAESSKSRNLPGGGFARKCPPLFPMQGGRHRQRAFRDAITDLLPDCHGFAPTLRIAYFELDPWIWSGTAEIRMRDLVQQRLSSS
jgi:hypothetical protein